MIEKYIFLSALGVMLCTYLRGIASCIEIGKKDLHNVE
jgi:hypothetical protein